MTIHFSDYDGQYRIAALCKTESSKAELLNSSRNVLFLEGNQLHLLPEDKWFSLSEKELDFISNCSDWDIFEMDGSGSAYRFYNSASSDNYLLVTNRCNCNCIMCPVPEGIRQKPDPYSVDELIKLVSYIPTDAEHLTITGGEPLMIRKGIFQLFQYLQENLNEIPYLLLTNGRAFAMKEYANLLHETAPSYLNIGIPLHGPSAELHDYIMQSSGSFDQTVHGIRNLLDLGFPVELRLVVSALNADFITDMASFIVHHFPETNAVKIMGMEMTGNASKNKDTLWLPYPEAFRKSQEGIDILVKGGIDTGLYNFPLCSVNENYWNLCERSISDYKIRYAEQCTSCHVRDACGGVFAGTLRLAEKDIEAL